MAAVPRTLWIVIGVVVAGLLVYGAARGEGAAARLVVVVAGVVLPWYWRDRAEELRQDREAMGLCAGCGYDLTGNVSGVCPECGSGRRGGR